jgi:hypothetical protein
LGKDSLGTAPLVVTTCLTSWGSEGSLMGQAGKVPGAAGRLTIAVSSTPHAGLYAPALQGATGGLMTATGKTRLAAAAAGLTRVSGQPGGSNAWRRPTLHG